MAVSLEGIVHSDFLKGESAFRQSVTSCKVSLNLFSKKAAKKISMTYLLLKIPPILFVYQHKVQQILDIKFLANISHRWSQIIAAQKQPNRY